MKLVFATHAWDDYLYWQVNDPTIVTRINTLIEECRRHPFRGTGKPEPLKGDLTGCWSRRVTLEHRLVYRVSGSGADQSLQIIQCRYHY
jgi:toxin YoeB